MTAQILTQEYLHTLFDYRDGELFLKNKIIAVGWYEKNGYKRTRINNKKYLIHRLIFLYHYGYFPEFIDHINNNKLNNKIENLREATVRENNLNVPTKKSNTSGIKGVCWSKQHKKWAVQLRHNGKVKHFGRYFDINVAKFVAETMRHKYHGQFACHV